LKPAVKVLFASGSDAVIALIIDRLKAIFPELPLIVISEFQPPDGEWIPYQVKRSWTENRTAIRWKLRDRKIRLCGVILEPNVPYWPIRLTGFSVAPWYLMCFNETGEHFMLRPRSIPAMFGHLAWRGRNFLRWQFHPGGWIYTQLWRIAHPREFRRPMYYRLALLRGVLPGRGHRRAGLPPAPAKPPGISVVIPSRNGRELLDRCLPRIYDADEIVVVDNGSDDGTARFLAADFPSVIVEQSAEPLSFATAVNRGIARARYSHVCLLNNDMMVEPGFLQALRRPFDEVPSLFAATAQIFFPSGQRREETGKTAMPMTREITDFPVRCEEPLEGEDHSYVLYGSGGCTLYDASKLALLGGFDEAYRPAYVEDLDLGVRAWQHGWPTVYCAGARVLHLHRTTTSRYFKPEDLDRALEFNYIRFLARAIEDRETFRHLWRENVVRLNLLKNVDALAFASHQRISSFEEGPTQFFDLVRGDTAVFPGRARSGKPVVMVASPYLPFPLSHGAAVRIYNLMLRAAPHFDQVLVAFVEEAAPVPRELLEICVEVVTVRRPGTHALPSSRRPDTVEEFDSPSFHAVLRQTTQKWRPSIAQLEFTQMAQYAADCAPAKTILVEHDITFDLYSQMLAQNEDWETRRQYDRWIAFERDAWKRVDQVVVMSDKDRRIVDGSVVIANGVDLQRFTPNPDAPEPRRLLFIGSFRHRPNVLAMEFFLREVFPRFANVTLHVIAGPDHERYWNLQHQNVEVEGFVADVRDAYRRATIVVAPLVASAGTNIKIMEAMAMGKAIVSTAAGIHGLEVEHSVILAHSPEQMAAAILHLLEHPDDRLALERAARITAGRLYDWDSIAAQQADLYRRMRT
jgi:GT2 family glycosyltransferase/glycosyltransferase involved in cell wall biosynthesis